MSGITFVSALLSAVTLGLTSANADGPEVQPVSSEKQAVLDEFQAAQAGRDPSDSSDPRAKGAPVETEPPKDAAPLRPITQSSFVIKGTGYFSLEIRLDFVPVESYLGYVVDCSSDEEQDMVILTDLSRLQTGTRTITAACSDLHKHFPADGRTMSMTPRTDDSPSSWEYWVRQVAITGVNEGRSRTEIQANVWYVTDRTGNYADMRLLQSIGYGENHPSKNVLISQPQPQPTLPQSGICGIGIPAFASLAFAGLVGLRRQTRRMRA